MVSWKMRESGSASAVEMKEWGGRDGEWRSRNCHYFATSEEFIRRTDDLGTPGRIETYRGANTLKELSVH